MLTKFIQQRHVHKLMMELFPAKPAFSGRDIEMIVPPGEAWAPALGNAFDYLLRFYAEHVNPGSQKNPWVASWGRELLRSYNAPYLERWADFSLALGEQARRRVVATGNFDTMSLIAAFRLVSLDARVRAGYFELHWCTNASTGSLSELRALAELLKDQSWLGTNGGSCLLNPSFGAASALVGGADADLLIGDTLVEVKTTKTLALSREMYHQLIAYRALASISGFNRSRHEVAHFAIYFARHGYFLKWAVNDYMSNENFNRFCTFLVESAPKPVQDRVANQKWS